MFKRLKDKIAEEVKQSPQRFDQISKGLQAAVSSASSTTSEVSGSENFFSITEDDTPQNSPQKGNSSTPVQPNNSSALANTSASSSVPSNTSLNNGISPSTSVTSPGSAPGNSSTSSASQQRTRRLSNSSMASDVSFRLPVYDSPAIYHLETDVDISASETESVSGSANANQLDLVSKDKLFQAYKKALDRYQKYRERYTELARRYRELEKDNTKARAVLVETQDKALRRMSELREQCVLEQQAKAHLDSALRMEIDELQCVVKTLRSKLELVGENGNASGGEKDLISLSGTEDGTNGNDGHVPVRDTGPLEDRIKALESKLNEELRQKAVLSLEVSELKKREEEHTITIAENKMAIHSELEAKEAEVRKLKEQLASLEKNMKQTLLEKDGLGKELSEVRKVAGKVKELESTLSTCNDQKNKLESKFIDFERTIMELEKDKQQLKATNLTLDYEKGELQKKGSEVEAKLSAMEKEKDGLLVQLQELQKTAQSLDKQAEIETLKQELEVAQKHEKELQTQVQELQKTAQSLDRKAEMDTLNQELEQTKKRLEDSTVKAATVEKQLSAKERELAELQSSQQSLEQKVKETEARLAEREKEIERLQKQQTEQSAKEREESVQKLQKAEEELAAFRKSQSLDQEKLLELTQALDAAKELHDRDRKSNETSLKELAERNNDLSVQLEQLREKQEKMTSKQKKIADEKNGLRATNEELSKELKQVRQELKQLTAQKEALAEEVRNLKIINENSESEALRSLQESMAATLAAAEAKRLETTRTLNHKMEVLMGENRTLSDERDELAEKLETAHEEKAELETERTNLRAKIETIRGEKRDLEKTLEREIREKTELKAQVENILQEIGRLEEQLKDIKEAHSRLQEEKQTLEEKIERLQREHCEARVKLEKDTLGKLQTKVKDHETKLQQVECENSQLAEKNCLLEESSRRTSEELKKLTAALRDAEARVTEEKDKSGRLEQQLSQCTGDHARLFNEKELLDHQHRSLQDALEAREKEKLCVLDTNKCLEEELTKVRSENDYLKGKHSELKALLESDKRRLMDQNDALQRQMEELAKEKQSLGRNATDLEKRLASYEEVKIENEYLNTFNKQLQGELQEAKGRVTAKDTELATVRTKQSQTEAMLEERDQEITKLINEFVAKEKKQEADQRQRLDELEQRHRTELDGVTSRVKGECEASFADERNALKDAQQALERQLEDARREQDTLAQKLAEQLRQKEDVERELRLENANFARDLDELKNELNAAIVEKLGQVKEHEQATMVLVAEKERLEAGNEQLRTRLAEFTTETEQNVRRFEAEIEQLKRDAAASGAGVTGGEQADGTAVTADSQQSYDELRNKKEELENKLKKIMHEVQDVSNRNLFLEQKCENYLILEQSNERLKLANDKLSRQLDETLVSMHHNEGIAANTEFEYLRNILFQYLSGSVTGNNSTLVKVIAAVLKFSPQQTQVVIEKEAHRRSLMGQINNLL
ncbi:golgin subfamily A member 4 isoform X2 [Anopheles stephensi]|uniref:golgin subfamily A member 4 isoform X2 n=1 Tax=Anopheles stephensi TaxID=30069 RepID=UPI00165884E4|nr:golgin subfamily A member 4 isoform X2 [Anopheles stephensi]